VVTLSRDRCALCPETGHPPLRWLLLLREDLKLTHVNGPKGLALRALVAAAFLLGVSWGSLNLGGDSVEVPSHRIPTAKGGFTGIAWLRSGWIVASFDAQPEAPGSTPHLVRLKPDGSGFEELPVPENPVCLQVSHVEPTALPDGRVGFISECSLPEAEGFGQDRLLAYDPKTEVTSPLVAGLLDPIPGPFTWNPSMDHGLIGAPNAPCVSISGLTRQGIERLPITVSDGGRSWRLDQLFLGPSTSDCQDLGNANWPAWSPDGRTIAFFASPLAMGNDGVSRLDSPWNLYFMDPGERRPHPVLKGIHEPQDLKWSPDGKWLAFGGEIGGKNGTWLYQPASHRMERVSSDLMNTLAWSPDGRQIAAVFQQDVSITLENELLVLDVDGVVSG
jgi:hypothetical protein